MGGGRKPVGIWSSGSQEMFNNVQHDAHGINSRLLQFADFKMWNSGSQESDQGMGLQFLIS
jgi:hypothetical protein